MNNYEHPHRPQQVKKKKSIVGDLLIGRRRLSDSQPQPSLAKRLFVSHVLHVTFLASAGPLEPPAGHLRLTRIHETVHSAAVSKRAAELSL